MSLLDLVYSIGIKEAEAEEDQGPLQQQQRQMWQGVQHPTHFKSSNTTMNEGNAVVAEELNHFFTYFEAKGPAQTLH